MGPLTIRRIIDERTRSTGELAAENPWSQSKTYHSTTVSHRSHLQYSGIKPGPMRWDATSILTRPRPKPTLTFTFSATYVNGSTVKCDKRSSTIANIRKEGLIDGNVQTLAWKVWNKLVTGADNISKHASNQRKYIVLQCASSVCSHLASTIN
jgi:hypothetical protein